MKRIRTTVAAAGVLVLTVFLSTYHSGRPRVLALGEVPISFWSWRTKTPTQDEVRNAFAATNAKSLFLRAGQLDLADGDVKRIRPVSGTLPKAPELHLVYNGTRKLLSDFERIDTGTLAHAVANTYRSDLSRAAKEGVKVDGIQLDLDVPTRLLPRYAELLRQLREQLTPDAAVSVTGLPTWTDSNEIYRVLETVDFWIPQCYGAQIPTRVDEQIPISSAKEVERTIAKARTLGKPFYAGLSAYGYAILYDKNGELVEIRGDLGPADGWWSKDLEVIESRAFKGDLRNGEIRKVYRAKGDAVIDGLIIRAGETLVVNVPTSNSLRAAARAVRENAGESLLGICVFRIPTADDKTTLSIGEIAAALSDRDTHPTIDVRLEAASEGELKIVANNSGDNAADPLTIEIEVPAGSVNGSYGQSGFNSYETLCRTAGRIAGPCSGRRANVIRLTVTTLRPSSSAWATLSLVSPLPAMLPASTITRTVDGRMDRRTYEIKIQNRGE